VLVDLRSTRWRQLEDPNREKGASIAAVRCGSGSAKRPWMTRTVVRMLALHLGQGPQADLLTRQVPVRLPVVSSQAPIALLTARNEYEIELQKGRGAHARIRTGDLSLPRNRSSEHVDCRRLADLEPGPMATEWSHNGYRRRPMRQPSALIVFASWLRCRPSVPV